MIFILFLKKKPENVRGYINTYNVIENIFSKVDVKPMVVNF